MCMCIREETYTRRCCETLARSEIRKCNTKPEIRTMYESVNLNRIRRTLEKIRDTRFSSYKIWTSRIWLR